MVSTSISSRRRKSRHHDHSGIENDVYVAYSEDDRERVESVLEYFRETGLRVFDPHTDGKPSKLCITWYLSSSASIVLSSVTMHTYQGIAL